LLKRVTAVLTAHEANSVESTSLKHVVRHMAGMFQDRRKKCLLVLATGMVTALVAVYVTWPHVLFLRYAERHVFEGTKVRDARVSFFKVDPQYVWQLRAPQDLASRLQGAQYFRGDDADMAVAVEVVSNQLKPIPPSGETLVYRKSARAFKKYVLFHGNDVYLVVVCF
jgi:hypothetical protein